MWNAGKNLTPEEIAIMREFEHLYFKFNPGFRAMWHDNFEEYFKGTLDEEYWERREREREKELEKIHEENMRDPEYASWRSELAIIEETMMGDPDESPVARARWFEREQWMKEAEEQQREYDRKLHDDNLYKLAKDWSIKLLKFAGPFYEKTRKPDWFRVLTNCLPVSGKIVFAAREWQEEGDDSDETFDDFSWRTDRAGYIQSLASLQRCIESLRKLKEQDPGLKVDRFLADGLIMQAELINRLDEIEQKFLSYRPKLKRTK